MQPIRIVIGKSFALAERERKALIAEMSKVSGLMPLLMKRRNNLAWSDEDLLELREHLRRLTRISPYLVILVMPGGFAMLPVLAWWLDRRRQRLALLVVEDRRSGADGRN